MAKNAEIPDGWAMPDDLANQVNKALNKKPITPEQELQDALDEMARDIALIEPNPEDWGGWMQYFLEQMEEESKRRVKHLDFERMLKSL
jgi:hypothetical protein